MIPRRDFLILTGNALIASRFMWGASEEIPPQLDHVILGCNDLEGGISFVQEHTGVLAVHGGTHPDRGTWNALLSLGERRFLEIMAPDPNAKIVQPWASQQLNVLRGLANPRPIGWAAHTDSIETSAKKCQSAGLKILGPWPGSRVRPDGKLLNWKTFSLADDHRGLLPFFIEWSKDSVHPSYDAPGGCHLEKFALAQPDTMELVQALRQIDVEAPIESSSSAQLHFRIVGPKGTLAINS